MNTPLLPCLYHPVSLVFVDDNENFLKLLKAKFSRNAAVHTFKDSGDALEFLKNYKSDPFTMRCVLEAEDQSADKRNLEIDIRAIRNEIMNPKRFSEVVIVVLDFAMPRFTGGEIAEQLKNSPFKIILLTGEADSETAIKLFNQGIIQAYIRKDSTEFKNLLTQKIMELEREYFLELSSIITNSLEQYHDYPHTWYKDPVFKGLFEQIYKENDLAEFYLLDEYGSYLYLDKKGKPSILAVTNAEMMATYLDYAKNDQSPEEVITGLQNKTKIPFFYSDDDFNVRPAEWLPYTHAAKVMEGQQTYYWAYITNLENYSIKPTTSLAEFLKNQDKK